MNHVGGFCGVHGQVPLGNPTQGSCRGLVHAKQWIYWIYGSMDPGCPGLPGQRLRLPGWGALSQLVHQGALLQSIQMWSLESGEQEMHSCRTAALRAARIGSVRSPSSAVLLK